MNCIFDAKQYTIMGKKQFINVRHSGELDAFIETVKEYNGLKTNTQAVVKALESYGSNRDYIKALRVKLKDSEQQRDSLKKQLEMIQACLRELDKFKNLNLKSQP